MVGPVPATMAMEMRVSLISRCWTAPCLGCSCIIRTYTRGTGDTLRWGSIGTLYHCLIIINKSLDIALLKKLLKLSLICLISFVLLGCFLFIFSYYHAGKCDTAFKRTMSGSGRWTQQDNVITLPALFYYHHQTFAPFSQQEEFII